MPITEQQLAIIREQLGREPRGIAAVAVDSPDGVPLVLQMRSMVDNQPFPTLFWLCSKDLCKAIGQIEGDGWVKQIETQLQQNSELRDQFYQDQHRYVARRWQLMDSGDRQDIEGAGLTPLFDRYGIGGITQWDKIRCLHMQYAHHLAEGNVIGALIEEQFGLKALTIRR